MELYLVRHGRAVSRAASDAERRLTPEGRAELDAALPGLVRHGLAVDRLFTSPLTRAQETAALLRDGLGLPEPELLPLVAAPFLPEELAGALAGQGERLAVVGHMPGLGDFVSWAAPGAGRAGGTFRPGSVARLDFEGRPAPGRGLLRWLQNPSELADFTG